MLVPRSTALWRLSRSQKAAKVLVTPSTDPHQYSSLGNMQQIGEQDALIEERPPSEAVHPADGVNVKATREDDSAKNLKCHTLSLWLATAFAIASTFIWAITCALSYKPIQFETYFDTTGRFSVAHFEGNDRWRRLSRVGLQVLAAVSLPLTSTVCASAAIVYTQRSRAISMRQMLVLADKGWLDVETWTSLIGPVSRRTRSGLLLSSILTCAICECVMTLQQQIRRLNLSKRLQFLHSRERSLIQYRRLS